MINAAYICTLYHISYTVMTAALDMSLTQNTFHSFLLRETKNKKKEELKDIAFSNGFTPNLGY